VFLFTEVRVKTSDEMSDVFNVSDNDKSSEDLLTTLILSEDESIKVCDYALFKLSLTNS